MAFFEGGVSPVLEFEKIHENVMNQFAEANIPSKIVQIMTNRADITTSGDALHRDAFRRKVPPHMMVISFDQISNIVSDMISAGYQPKFKGCYGFHYSTISLNNENHEVVKSGNHRYSSCSVFSVAIEIKDSNGKNWIVGLSTPLSKFRTPSGSSRLKYMTTEFESDVIEVIKSCVGTRENTYQEFVNFCKEKLKNETNCN